MSNRLDSRSFKSPFCTHQKKTKNKKKLDRRDAHLTVKLLKCSNLPKADNFGKCDPYVKFINGKNEVKSSTIKKQLNPVWKGGQTLKPLPVVVTYIYLLSRGRRVRKVKNKKYFSIFVLFWCLGFGAVARASLGLG